MIAFKYTIWYRSEERKSLYQVLYIHFVWKTNTEISRATRSKIYLIYAQSGMFYTYKSRYASSDVINNHRNKLLFFKALEVFSPYK